MQFGNVYPSSSLENTLPSVEINQIILFTISIKNRFCIQLHEEIYLSEAFSFFLFFFIGNIRQMHIVEAKNQTGGELFL